ncbi:transposase [Sporomusa carbonis]|uniref:transposase n=1 Tax=Sporomusa carbonis TaxID=3076075 RepID=UPI003C7D09F0
MRWQIELFFKWIKQHFVVKHFFGTSQNAVYGQIWLALIGYCLLQSICQQLPKKHSLLEVLRAIQISCTRHLANWWLP